MKQGVLTLMTNSGQNCNAPSRMLVPEDRLEEVEAIAVATLGKLVVGDPQDDTTTLGPVANGAQFARVQQMIDSAISDRITIVIVPPPVAGNRPASRSQ